MENDLTYRFRTESNLLVRVRPLRPGDSRHLIDLFHHLSPDSRYRRFNISLADPDPNLVRRRAEAMADIDPAVERGWLAFADLADQQDACVAGVRCIRLDGDVAEVSIAVRDDAQDDGIGTELLRFVGQQAYQGGIRQLVGHVQSDNRPLWRSLRQLGVPLDREFRGAETYVTVDLEEASRRGQLARPQAPPKT